jgi:hypothetical protein
MENGSRKNDALYTTYLDHLIGIRIKAENSTETAEVRGQKELAEVVWFDMTVEKYGKRQKPASKTGNRAAR